MFSENGSIQQILRNVSNIEKISFDIGNRVVKVAYLSSCSSTRTTLTGEQNDESPSSRIHCIQVSCANFPQLLSYIAENSDIDSAATVYTSTAKNDNIANEIACKLKPSLQRVEVAECIFIGTNFLLKNIEAETYTYNHQGSSKYDFTTVHPEMIFPYMVVNVGTGVSIIRVDSETEFNRIGGSSIGGGTFVGIGTLLTEEGGHCHVYVSSAFCDVADVEKLIKMAEEGDHRAFDLLVSDIYGSRFDSLGLPEDLIASSFAKHAAKKPLDWSQKCNAMRSLLFMIMNNIGQLAWLYANREDIKKIYFNGFLVRNHPVVMRAITYALDFWSAGTLKAHFLRHESYTSVIGAILKSASREKASQWWRESYIGCTSMGRFVPTDPLSEGFAARTLELECAAFSAYPFPLLADASYVPDEVNLIADKEAMTFWLNIMQSSVSKVSEMARSSQVKSETVEERAAEFEKSFIKKVDIIREKPFAYGHANVRNLLELREQVLNEHKFDDPYLTQKHAENYAALKDLRGVLGKIDNVGVFFVVKLEYISRVTLQISR